MPRPLIYDVGMHLGEDTAFYLWRGFRVVGVEANPALIPGLRDRFAAEIASGDVTIVAKAVAAEAGTVRFTIDERSTEWSSLDPAFIARNASRGSSQRTVEVEAVTLASIIDAHGPARYIKIDVEGADIAALASLRAADAPRLISIETTVGAPENRLAEELRLLSELGYKRFKFVDQSRLQLLDRTKLDIEGAPIVYAHIAGASGPFGAEAPGAWMTLGEAETHGAQLRSAFERYSPMAPRRSRLAVRLRRWFGLPGFGWYDLHAEME